ncbi:CDP-alcohol phosphatidyltransferase [Popillia japonica]|uniref:CDP-diacylglycerol--inositol 3-phosphatidyltransferase n=1 Tax=Popillia japonica TaxID=7064 RepID=A0AAW1N1W8_POPJA
MSETEENIFLFYPNIIGFARVILAIISFYYMSTNYILSSVCYITSALLDAVDGIAARHFNQSTKFGAILDQLTDRVGTMCLCAVLAHFYPNYMFFFLISMGIDVACHWIYLHTSLLQGKALAYVSFITNLNHILLKYFRFRSLLQGKASHKFVDLSSNPIMHHYYSNRNFLFFMCMGNEMFYCTLYLLYFTPGPSIFGMSLFKMLLYISTPIALAKSFISIVHCCVAAKNLSIIDVNERKALREKSK